jgi:hypothetical protein
MVRLLRDQDNDVLYAAETLISAQDEIVLQTATTENRILLTFDRISGSWRFVAENLKLLGLCYFASARYRQRHSSLLENLSSRLNQLCAASLLWPVLATSAKFLLSEHKATRL